MLVSYTYTVWRSNPPREMLICLPEEEGVPDLQVTINGEEWTRLSDPELDCIEGQWQNPRKPAEVRLVKCGRFECHRQELGVCQCGLHQPDEMRLRPAAE